MQKNVFWRRVLAVGLVAWMGFIFVMSSFPAGVSSQQSGVVVEVVEKVFRVDSAARPEVVGNLTEIVRKSAHAFEYLVLGVLMVSVMRVILARKVGARNAWWMAIVACMVFAISDEIHQIFVSGRACELRDVVNDTMAASIGVGIAMAIKSVWGRWRRRAGREG